MTAQHPTASKRLYLTVWAVLMMLLFLTWGAAQLDLKAFNLAVALTIATVKMMLVILFFMHVRHSSPITRLFVAAGFAWLLILFVLTMSDYLTRGTGAY